MTKSIAQPLIRKKIPILAFSDKYLKKGACFAVSLDIAKMGRQAANLADQIRNGAKPSDLKPLQIDHVELKRNNLIIDKLGLAIQETSQ